MQHINIAIDDRVKSSILVLKEHLYTENTSHVVRYALAMAVEIFLGKKFPIGNISLPNNNFDSLASAISDLSGMDLDVVESHFVRFRKYHPTIEIYRAAIEAVKAEAAAKGEPVKNPEAALYGKLKQWATGKWKPTVSVGAVVPPPPGLKSQKEIEKELYGA